LRAAQEPLPELQREGVLSLPISFRSQRALQSDWQVANPGATDELDASPGRWYFVGSSPAEETPVGGGQSTQAGIPEPVVLDKEMRVGDAIQSLLRKSTICVDTDGGETLLYVRVAGTGAAASAEETREGLCCIALTDLLEAPRQMPLRCLLGIDDDGEECELYETPSDSYTSRGAMAELVERLPWLLGLMAFLTVSSAVLESYDYLLQRHLIIAFYLTALVGCGGNSGSQAASMVLQSMARGELLPTMDSVWSVLQKELTVALGVAAVLASGVAARIVLFGGSNGDALTIAAAMAMTVVFSTVFGAMTPLLLKRLGVDPAKVSGPLLSTVIDIVGALIAVFSGFLVESAGGFQ